ncbi:MAG TPA: ribosomal protein S18-alanine N-acetyltransferase [Jatrophihabitantaceae bacterium]|jgi:ribosomal-protein-alanine N-acetyltransferase
MMTVDVVPMTRAHITALMPYEQELFGAEAWTADGYRDELADKRHRHYLTAVDENQSLLGWAGVRIVADSAEILTVGVIPAARRQGIAARLLAMLLDEARRRGAVEAFLEVRVDNPGAQRLYERARFVKVGVRRGYYDGGRVDAVVMRRAL